MNNLFKYYQVNVKGNKENKDTFSDGIFHFGSMESVEKWIHDNKDSIESFKINLIEFYPCNDNPEGRLYVDITPEYINESSYVDLLNVPDYILNRKVLVQGTNSDRKRKLSDEAVKEIRYWWEHRIFTIKELCEMYNVKYNTIKYHIIDDNERKAYNKKRNEYRNDSAPQSKAELANYKRNLIKNNMPVIVR